MAFGYIFHLMTSGYLIIELSDKNDKYFPMHPLGAIKCYFRALPFLLRFELDVFSLIPPLHTHTDTQRGGSNQGRRSPGAG